MAWLAYARVPRISPLYGQIRDWTQRYSHIVLALVGILALDFTEEFGESTECHDSSSFEVTVFIEWRLELRRG